jgi:hypothetical protein
VICFLQAAKAEMTDGIVEMQDKSPQVLNGGFRLDVATTPSSAKGCREAKAFNKPVPLASSLHSFSSSDGDIYVFQEDGRLDIVSPDGSVEQEFKLKSPAE